MIRHLSIHDYSSFIETLNELGETKLSEDEFIKIYSQRTSTVQTYVYTDGLDQVVGTISLLLEQKFLHGGIVAHIEDLVVKEEFRGKGIGRSLIGFIENKAREAGAYKIILDCRVKNVGFYEKLGFLVTEYGMRKNVV